MRLSVGERVGEIEGQREREREFVQREEEYRRRNGVLNFKSVSHFLALEEK